MKIDILLKQMTNQDKNWLRYLISLHDILEPDTMLQIFNIPLTRFIGQEIVSTLDHFLVTPRYRANTTELVNRIYKKVNETFCVGSADCFHYRNPQMTV